MTTKQRIHENAEALARDVLSKQFNRAAPEDLVQSVAKRLFRSMPIRTIAKITADQARQMAAAD